MRKSTRGITDSLFVLTTQADAASADRRMRVCFWAAGAPPPEQYLMHFERNYAQVIKYEQVY